MSKIINYNFHNLLKVKVVLRNTVFCEKYLANTFGYYVVDDISYSDLTFILDGVDVKKENGQARGDFWVKENYIYRRFKHRTKMVVEVTGLESTETIVRINCNWLNSLRAVGCIFFPLIKFKLGLKGYPALFGSAVSGKNGAIVLLAKGRTGKTTMVLWAIKHGFKFLGDGSVIIGTDKVYSFITPLNIFVDHLALVRDLLSLKSKITIFFNKFLYLVSGKRHKLFAQVKPLDIFPDCVVEESLPSNVCLLQRRGNKFVIDRDVDKTAIIKEMISIHESTDDFITEMLSAYTSVFTNSELVNYRTNLELVLYDCLKDAKFHRITFPEKYSFELVSRVFEEMSGESVQL